MELNRAFVKLIIIAFLVFWLTQGGGQIATFIYFLAMLFYIVSLRYTFIPHQKDLEILGIFILGAILRTAAILNNKNPPIDVYYLSSEGVELLLKGMNPYSATYRGPPGFSWPYGSQIVQGYPPLMLVILGFGYFLSDVRFSILMSDLIVAYLLYALAKDKNLGLLLAVVYTLNPFSIILIINAWNESVLVTFLLVSILMLKEEKKMLSSIFLGLALGVKQFTILFAPYMWRTYTKTQILVSLLIGAAIYFPFLLMSPYDLIYDLFLFFNYVRYDSISLIPLFLRPLWKDPTKVPSTIRTAISIIQFSTTFSIMLKFLGNASSIERIAYYFSLTSFIFLILSPISNVNYFYLLPPFLALGIMETIAKSKEKIATL